MTKALIALGQDVVGVPGQGSGHLGGSRKNVPPMVVTVPIVP